MICMAYVKKDVHLVIDKIKKIGGEKIKFIILFGSFAEGKQTPLSDIDLAVYYDGSKEERFKFRIEILGNVNNKFDIQIFQDLPLYVRKEVLKGKILYDGESRFLYEVERRTYQDFDDFKNRFYDYIRGGVIV